MLTVSSLLSDCGLELTRRLPRAATAPCAGSSISEHEDPTPWLSGGEVLLTTGYNLDTAAKQRAYVARLAKHEVAALGFGDRASTTRRCPARSSTRPRSTTCRCSRCPYEMPFIAITERAAARLVNEQYDALTRGSKVHEQLERLVIDGGGHRRDHRCDRRGSRRLRARLRRRAPPGGAPPVKGLPASGRCRPDHGGDRRQAGLERRRRDLVRARGARRTARLVVPVPGRRGAPPAGWLVVLSERGALGEFERLLARQASIVVGLELMRERVVNETERRLAGDLLADALSGRLDPEELGGRLQAVRDRVRGGRAGLLARRPARRRRRPRDASCAVRACPRLVATASTASGLAPVRRDRNRRRRSRRDRARGAESP